MRNLAFIDCETTGLNETKDHIVEVAIVVVDVDANFREIASFSRVSVPPLWPTVRRNMHEKVLAMHAASGLLGEIDAAAEDEHHVQAHVEVDAVEFIQRYAPQTAVWHTPMAGANPDFDRRFLRARMPKLHAKFHYRNFDVRSITQLQDWIFGQAHTESPHRALPDARKAVADLCSFIGARNEP